ncbi:hypothetical protein HHI36_023527 [Cryptolaemus montrouzieri]|uniref:Uncharacterized protein n=1 Tax=Cryptolaemus montrouzieri TaxID=559131 RepID=A0ABD2PHJ6_9CUCU
MILGEPEDSIEESGDGFQDYQEVQMDNLVESENDPNIGGTGYCSDLEQYQECADELGNAILSTKKDGSTRPSVQEDQKMTPEKENSNECLSVTFNNSFIPNNDILFEKSDTETENNNDTNRTNGSRKH